MGYMFTDGSPDNLADAVLCSRIFAVALSTQLNNNEGICADLVFQESFPNEPYGKVIVYLENNQVKVMKIPNNAKVINGEKISMVDPY